MTRWLGRTQWPTSASLHQARTEAVADHARVPSTAPSLDLDRLLDHGLTIALSQLRESPGGGDSRWSPIWSSSLAPVPEEAGRTRYILKRVALVVVVVKPIKLSFEGPLYRPTIC